ncbi:hypothetical protein [Nocardioides zeae]|uniref:DUF1542 domain-containing protein n=1 Tax=Nocardioides zeae TaxID=1457234 RepID=A0A6P0HSS4_9ACTN|nr:hypothetical protein [Nocardioides zeae]NEN80225.1 hypothetical protein [Nocardioides zeae]
MTGWVVLLVLVALAAAAGVVLVRRRRAEQLAAADALRRVTAVAEEDVTRFGEELQELHVETLVTDLDVPMRQDYQRALDAYEAAKDLLRDVEQPADVKGVTRSLEDGRHAMACVLARQEGEPLPERLSPCFFNPAHGPSTTEAAWAPPGGVERDVPVCRADADRLAAGAEPDTRMVRRDGAMVPWYDGGAAYRPYVSGYYGQAAANGLFPAVFLGAVLAGPALGTSGFDGTGLGGGDGGGFDGGGFDGGGFDGGGGLDGGGGFDGGF